jgi:hypothetical protein
MYLHAYYVYFQRQRELKRSEGHVVFVFPNLRPGWFIIDPQRVHRVNSISIRKHPLNTPTPASLTFQLQSAGTHTATDNDY